MCKWTWFVALIFVTSISSFATAQPADTAAIAQDSKLIDTWMSMSSQFNDRLLATVYWALGVIGVVFAGLLGYSWFVNVKIYERDKLALQAELKAQLESEFALMRKNFDEIQKAFDAEIRASMQHIVEGSHEVLERKISRLDTSFSDEKNRIWLELYKDESYYWEEKKVFTNAVRADLKKGELGIKSKSGWAVDDALSRLEEFLPHISKSQLKYVESDIAAFLTKASADWPTHCQRIRQILENK